MGPSRLRLDHPGRRLLAQLPRRLARYTAAPSPAKVSYLR